MNILRKIGDGFKWIGKKTLWLIRRNEVLIAVSLASGVIPVPALDKIILLVRSLDRKNVPGDQKMAEALERIIPILTEYGIDMDDESDVRFVIELAVKMMKKRARVIPAEGN